MVKNETILNGRTQVNVIFGLLIAFVSERPKGVRLGYMGHLTLISEHVVTALERFPPDLRLIIQKFAPDPEWDEYVTGRYDETRRRDARLLGGGKPVVNSATSRNVARWKVDEDDTVPPGDTDTSVNGGVRGEFRRASSLAPVKSTADFGSAPMDVMENDDDDDDANNQGSSRAPHVCHRSSSVLVYVHLLWPNYGFPVCSISRPGNAFIRPVRFIIG